MSPPRARLSKRKSLPRSKSKKSYRGGTVHNRSYRGVSGEYPRNTWLESLRSYTAIHPNFARVAESDALKLLKNRPAVITHDNYTKYSEGLQNNLIRWLNMSISDKSVVAEALRAIGILPSEDLGTEDVMNFYLNRLDEHMDHADGLEGPWRTASGGSTSRR